MDVVDTAVVPNIEDTDVVDALDSVVALIVADAVEGTTTADVTDALGVVSVTGIVESANVELPLFPVTSVLAVESGMVPGEPDV